MANIIPMSGSGSRFAEMGYILPKPLIFISGKPMILQVIRALPAADKWIFIVRAEHVRDYGIDKVIKAEIPDAIIVEEDNPTGQAPSTALALPHLDENEEMFVAACDNGFLYDEEEYRALIADKENDMIVWTFTENELLSQKPEAWGWAKLKDDRMTIDSVSVKTPVSSDPFYDHAIVASFYFRRAADFKASYEMMVRENYRINNEFYVDAMPIFYKKLGKKSVIFDVNLYVGWGKPADVYAYEEREYRYRYQPETFAKGDPWLQFFKKTRNE
jgi:NDP-sugar pyrophosphorylase family protein